MSTEIYLKLDALNVTKKEPDLKDLSILLYSVMPRWVTSQLANELSKRLSLDYNSVMECLLDIEDEYSKLSRDEALKRRDKLIDSTILRKELR